MLKAPDPRLAFHERLVAPEALDYFSAADDHEFLALRLCGHLLRPRFLVYSLEALIIGCLLNFSVLSPLLVKLLEL